MKARTFYALAVLTACAIPLTAQEGAASQWSGSASASFGAAFDGDGYDESATFKNALVFEAGGGFSPSFRAEGGLSYRYGAASDLALAFDAGIAAAPDPQAIPPGTDLHGGLYVDQAYASAGAGAAWFRFGIVPTGSGAAWLYNPTSRIGAIALDRDPSAGGRGTPGLTASVSLPAGFSVEAGAFAAPRNANPVPDLGELNADGFPLSLRLQYRGSAADFSAAAVRERLSADSGARWWFGADAGFDALGASWYAEGAASAARVGEPRPEWSTALSPNGAVAETSCGFMYTLPLWNAEARAEYLWFSAGAGKPEEYDAAKLLSGSLPLLARSYLFASVEVADQAASRWTVVGGALGNITDGSVAFLGEVRFTVVDDFEVRFEGAYCGGKSGGEFNAPLFLGPGIEVRPWRTSLSLGMEAWF